MNDTHYRRVLTSERLPQEDEYYYTNLGELYLSINDGWQSGDDYNQVDFDQDAYKPEWWLEPIVGVVLTPEELNSLTPDICSRICDVIDEEQDDKVHRTVGLFLKIMKAIKTGLSQQEARTNKS